MMINSIDDIVEIFNIFHDGTIVTYRKDVNNLILQVKISYLTERIREDYSYFTIILFNCSKTQFLTWPNQKDNDPKLYDEPQIIFRAKLEILDAKTRN